MYPITLNAVPCRTGALGMGCLRVPMQQEAHSLPRQSRELPRMGVLFCVRDGASEETKTPQSLLLPEARRALLTTQQWADLPAQLFNIIHSSEVEQQ